MARSFQQASSDSQGNGGNAVSNEQLLVFQLGSEEYAVPKSKVKEIVGFYWLTPLSAVPEYIAGIIHLRGKVILVMDLAKRLGMALAQADDKYNAVAKRFGLTLARTDGTKLVIVEEAGLEIGVVVDEVKEVLTIAEGAIEPTGTVATLSGRFLRGIGKLEDRPVIILDLDKLLCMERETLQNVEKALISYSLTNR